MPAKSCVVCMAAATVFCNHDDAFLCSGCSTKIHSANALAASHSVLPICGVCSSAVSSFYCNNDKAFLCGPCNLTVHAANPVPHNVISSREALAQQKQQQVAAPVVAHESFDEVSGTHEPAPVTAEADAGSGKLMEEPKEPKVPFGKEFDFLELDSQWLDRLDIGFDFADLGLDAAGVVPDVMDDVHMVPTLSDFKEEQEQGASLGAMQAADSFDFGVVPVALPSWLDEQEQQQQVEEPESFAATEVPPVRRIAAVAPPGARRPPKRTRSEASLAEEQESEEYGVVPVYQPVAVPAPAVVPPPPPPRPAAPTAASTAASLARDGSAMTRAERVARYLEKKKNRKFEKTIRYASRKAYAEIRPRIKGRFATKEEVEAWKLAKMTNPEAQLQALS